VLHDATVDARFREWHRPAPARHQKSTEPVHQAASAGLASAP
jgi:hypothetical protein